MRCKLTQIKTVHLWHSYFHFLSFFIWNNTAFLPFSFIFSFFFFTYHFCLAFNFSISLLLSFSTHPTPFFNSHFSFFFIPSLTLLILFFIYFLIISPHPLSFLQWISLFSFCLIHLFFIFSFSSLSDSCFNLYKFSLNLWFCFDFLFQFFLCLWSYLNLWSNSLFIFGLILSFCSNSLFTFGLIIFLIQFSLHLQFYFNFFLV